MLYAHDVIDDPSFEIEVTILADMGLRAVDAVGCLNQAGRNQWNFEEGELGSIDIHDAAERDHGWEFQQAMDKVIKAIGLGLVRSQTILSQINGSTMAQRQNDTL